MSRFERRPFLLCGLTSSCSSSSYHIFQRELGALGHHIPIDGNHGTAVIVQPVTITTLLVSKQVDPSALTTRKHQNNM